MVSSFIQLIRSTTATNKLLLHLPSLSPPGAVLVSQNERNLDCVVTFQTHSILQRFMLRFDMLQLDCNDHLYIYDGSHAVGTHKVCGVEYSQSFIHIPDIRPFSVYTRLFSCWSLLCAFPASSRRL